MAQSEARTLRATHTSTHLGRGVEEGEEGKRLATWQLADKF